MTHEQIASVIDAINDGSGSDRIFLTPLTQEISVGKVWIKYPKGETAFESSDLFYFVFDSEGVCTAAVLDMGSDLHVYVVPAHRRKGIMTRALRDWILPHLLRDKRTEQQASFDSSESRGLLEKVGFKITSDSKAVMRKEDCLTANFPSMPPMPFQKDRMEAIKKRIRMAAGFLQMAQDELAVALPDEYHDLPDVIQALSEIDIRVEDRWWDQQKQPPDHG